VLSLLLVSGLGSAVLYSCLFEILLVRLPCVLLSVTSVFLLGSSLALCRDGLFVGNTKSMEGTWMERLEPERIKKMSEEAVKRQRKRDGWNSEHLKGVPLADLKEALAETWVKR